MSSDLPKQLSTIHMATGGSTALALFHLIQDWMPGRRLLHPPGPKALPIIGSEPFSFKRTVLSLT